MRRWIGNAVLGGVMIAAAVAAEDPFSRAVPSADFSAAGLAKLTPEELARLDALVRDFKSGALEKARREAAAAEARAAKAEAKAAAAVAQAETKPEAKTDSSLLARAKVLLMPGTQIEYATVESRIAGTFRGWEQRTIFTLENGQRWQVSGGESYTTPAVPGPAVKITPGALGSFWMTIAGVRPQVRVVLVSRGN